MNGDGRPRSRTARLILAGALLLPLAELTLAIAVGRVIGAPLTVLLLIAVSVSGGYVLRHAGARAARALRRPAPSPDDLREAGDAGWLMIGGVLLLVPGFLTGVTGALLALPATRRLLRPVLGRTVGTLAQRLAQARGLHVFSGGPDPGDKVIPGDVVHGAGEEPPPPGDTGRAGRPPTLGPGA